MIDTWQELTTATLIGVERHPFTLPRQEDSLTPNEEEAARVPSGGAARNGVDFALASIGPGTVEEGLLKSAAVATVFRRAGGLPRRAAELPPAPAEDDQLCECPAAVGPLLRMEFGVYQGVLPEALGRLAARRERIPHDLLPVLLDFGRQHADLRDLILDVIDNRGTWLAGLNPSWEWAAAIDDDDWDDSASRSGRARASSFDARINTLIRLDRRGPDEARRRLRAALPNADADIRARMLGSLRGRLAAGGGTLDDEDLLEEALDDRSVAVRRVAADLLAYLPDSRFVARMAGRLRAAVSARFHFTGRRLDVVHPGEFDPGFVRDAVLSVEDPKGRAASPPPDQNAWLQAVASSVPPQFWSEHLGRSPSDIVALIAASDWADTLFAGLAAASTRHPDPVWITALLRQSLARATVLHEGSLGAAVSTLPAASIEPILTELLANTPIAGLDNHRWLLVRHTAWTVDFGRTVIASLHRNLTEFGGQQTQYAVAAILSPVAIRLPPTLVDEFDGAFPAELVEAGGYWSRQRDQWTSLLRFRADLHAALPLETA
ncbi:MAG: DUF5691 domain-containing protein [Capsulimonadaceae bacterium]